MPSVQQWQTWREQFFSELYAATGADTGARVDLPEIGDRFGLGGQDLAATARFLKDTRLVKFDSPAPDIIGPVSITHRGIERVEAQRQDEPTDGDHSSGPDLRAELAVVLAPAERSEVEAVVGMLRRAFDAGELTFSDEEDRADFQAQLDTLNDQLRSPKPKRTIVGRTLWALRWAGSITAVGVLGNAAWDGLLRLLQHFA
jgi:hypothetical protein